MMGAAPGSTVNVARSQSGATNTSGNPAKYVFVTSRPSTPVQVCEAFHDCLILNANTPVTLLFPPGYDNAGPPNGEVSSGSEQT